MKPINFKHWIEENRHLLKPPVGNKQIWEDRDFMVTVVGGPNARMDFHVNEGEEFFYQVEGNITLRIIDPDEASHSGEANESPKFRDIPIREGEIFLLPPRVPHSPQRPPGTVGLVLERKRAKSELDGFIWFCENCGQKLHETFVHVTHLVEQLPGIFKRFFDDETHCVCKKCGTRAQKN